MEHMLASLKIIGSLALLVLGYCGCASTGVQKSAAEKEREERYSNYVDNIDRTWSVHL
jgi:hypothetical protein